MTISMREYLNGFNYFLQKYTFRESIPNYLSIPYVLYEVLFILFIERKFYYLQSYIIK